MNNNGVAVVIVTYNRRAVLAQTLAAWAAQTRRPDGLYVVDNASTDDTRSALAARREIDGVPLHVVTMPSNAGGAGGFAAGMRAALAAPFERIVLADDDARPATGCLEHLLAAAVDEGNLYGASAFCETDPDRLCWPQSPRGVSKSPAIEFRAAMAPVTEVHMVPFLGVLVHRNLARRIGVPDAAYFLSGDDVEYCLRACGVGARVLQVRDAAMTHPAPPVEYMQVAGRRVFVLKLPVARQYFEIRNRLWNARRYYGWYGVLDTLAANLLRMAWAHRTRPGERMALLASGLRGLRDGLFSRAGARYRGDSVS